MIKNIYNRCRKPFCLFVCFCVYVCDWRFVEKVAHLGLYEKYYERKTPAVLVFDDFSKIKSQKLQIFMSASKF